MGAKMNGSASGRMSGPQVSATSSAARASSATPVSRHRTSFGEAPRLKKDFAEQRATSREVTESMLDSVYALQLSSRRAARAPSISGVTKVPLKTSAFRKMDLDSGDLPPIGSSPISRIPFGNNQLATGRRPGSASS